MIRFVDAVKIESVRESLSFVSYFLEGTKSQRFYGKKQVSRK